jgi:CheY-like chemotaxis protein
MDYDADKLMHIVSNLLSNALKFNKEGNIVGVFSGPADKSERKFMITVADNGPGISQEHLPHIFDRFYRIEGDSGQYENGSGLGLALTRELVNLMDGNICVKSSPEDGTIFTIVLPVSNEAPLKEMARLSEPKEQSVAQNHHTARSQNIAPEAIPEESERQILLIVEDSPDLVDYLEAVLKEDYLLEFASNGKEGLQKAFESIPDIILSDVMMPEMDGITMLEKIKTDERTSHIPVIMLTAKADIASKLQGFERGADAYLAKPFNEEELKIRLKKLIELRKLLRQRYSSMDVLPKSDDQTIKTEDAFMSKIRSIMEAHLDNEQFGILELCREAGMSRAQLYRKFKTLTDKTVNEYLIQFRLFKANELLSNTDLNVSEVAWEVGFKNLSHFSRVYSETFGHSPGSNRK